MQAEGAGAVAREDESSGGSPSTGPATALGERRGAGRTSPRCRISGCTRKLLKQYHQVHGICQQHCKALCISTPEGPQRFCQQCAKLHLVGCFEGDKRNCRDSLLRRQQRKRELAQLRQGEEGVAEGRGAVELPMQRRVRRQRLLPLEESSDSEGVEADEADEATYLQLQQMPTLMQSLSKAKLLPCKPATSGARSSSLSQRKQQAQVQVQVQQREAVSFHAFAASASSNDEASCGLAALQELEAGWCRQALHLAHHAQHSGEDHLVAIPSITSSAEAIAFLERPLPASEVLDVLGWKGSMQAVSHSNGSVATTSLRMPSSMHMPTEKSLGPAAQEPQPSQQSWTLPFLSPHLQEEAAAAPKLHEQPKPAASPQLPPQQQQPQTQGLCPLSPASTVAVSSTMPEQVSDLLHVLLPEEICSEVPSEAELLMITNELGLLEQAQPLGSLQHSAYCGQRTSMPSRAMPHQPANHYQLPQPAAHSMHNMQQQLQQLVAAPLGCQSCSAGNQEAQPPACCSQVAHSAIGSSRLAARCSCNSCSSYQSQLQLLLQQHQEQMVQLKTLKEYVVLQQQEQELQHEIELQLQQLLATTGGTGATASSTLPAAGGPALAAVQVQAQVLGSHSVI